MARGAAGAIGGLLLVGFAIAPVAPTTLSLAGRSAPGRSGQAVATATAAGYGAFILGPLTIGLLAQATGLRPALGLLVLTSLGLAGLATRWPVASDRRLARLGACGRVLQQVPELLDVGPFGIFRPDRDPYRPHAVQQRRCDQGRTGGVDRVHPGERVLVQPGGVQAGGFVPEHDRLQADRGQDTPAGGRFGLLRQPAGVVQVPAQPGPDHLDAVQPEVEPQLERT